MKTLLLIRHAKSSWANEGQDDFDRGLNDRGKSDAPQMAKRVQAKIPHPGLLISSPAKRALKTATLFAQVFGMPKTAISLHDALYLASASTIYQTVALLPDDTDNVFLFAHNPGITEAANMLSGVRIDNMPTCGVFGVAANVDSWAAFGSAEKKFLFFDYPKNPLG